MGKGDRAFRSDDLEVDTNLTSSCQRIFTDDSLIKRRCQRIYGVGGFGNYYQKPCHGDVLSTLNRNHKTTSDTFWRGNESTPTNATLECICAERKVKSFLVEGKVCNQTFNTNSSNLVQRDLRDIC